MTRMIRSRANWKKAWTEDEIYNQFVKDNPQHKAAAKDDVVKAYLEQRDASGAPLFEAFEKSDNPIDYLHKAGSNIAPSLLTLAKETIEPVARGTASVLSGAVGLLNPFQAPEARVANFKSMVETGKQVLPAISGAIGSMAENLEGAGTVALSANMPWNSQLRQQASIAPVTQHFAEKPAQTAADLATVGYAVTAPLRIAGRALPGAVGQTAEAVARPLQAAAEVIDPFVATSRAARRVAATKPVMAARRSAARGLMNSVLEVNARDYKDIPVMQEAMLEKNIPVGRSTLQGGKPTDPRHTNVEQAIEKIDTRRQGGVALAEGSKKHGAVDAAKVPEGARETWTKAQASGSATQKLGTAWDTINEFVQTQGHPKGIGLRPELRPGSTEASKAAAATTRANQGAERASDVAEIARERAEKLREIADAAPDGDAKVNANIAAAQAEAEAKKLATLAGSANERAADLSNRIPEASELPANPQNPTFDESVKYIEPPGDISIRKLDNYRKITNQELDEFYSNVLERGKEDPAMKNLVKKGMRDEAAKLEADLIEKAGKERFAQQRSSQGLSTSGPDFDEAFKTSGFMTADEFRKMGQQEHLLMEIRAAVRNSLLKHHKRAVPIQEQPYMVGQTGSAVTSLLSGQGLGPTQAAAAGLFNLRILGKYFPEKASRLALRLYHTNPNPKFWGEVFNYIRASGEGLEHSKNTPPPVPPGVQAKPVNNDGPLDFK